jgi:predicted nuclease with TOPRIM domain
MSVLEIKMDKNIKESIARMNSQHTNYESTINRLETEISHLINMQRKSDDKIIKLTRTIDEHIRTTPSPEIILPTSALQPNNSHITQKVANNLP